VDLEIQPYESMGPIRLGMRIEELRWIIPGKRTIFKRDPSSALTEMHFEDHGILVEYVPSGICISVEVALPANPLFQDKQLLQTGYGELEAWFLSLDPKLKINTAGFTSIEYGIGVYAPFGDEEPEEPPEGVIVFERGYYEKKYE